MTDIKPEPVIDTSDISKALIKVQDELENPPKTATNPFYKSKYTPLEDILNLIRPILTRHGLYLFQDVSGDGETISVTTYLMHKSGATISTGSLTLKPEKATSQGAGSAITYARRYQLSGFLNIASEDDDDGEVDEHKYRRANKPTPSKKPAKKPPIPNKPSTPSKQKKSGESSDTKGNDYELIRKLGTKYGILNQILKTKEEYYDDITIDSVITAVKMKPNLTENQKRILLGELNRLKD